MELENIKDIWQKDLAVTPEISLDKQKEIRMPLEKIRQGMKLEFWCSVGLIPFLFLYFFYIKDTSRLFYFSAGIFIFLVIITYYFAKFFKLYKKLSTQEFSTYHNLLNLRYELVLNTELYKSYYIATVPILMCLLLSVYVGREGVSPLFMFMISLFLGFLILYIMGKVWIREVYGKHIVQISDLVDNLSSEKPEFQFNRNSLKGERKYFLIEKSRNFFEEKFGKKGRIVHIIFWTVAAIFALLLFSYLIGYGIGFTAAKMNLFDIETIQNLK